MRNVSANAKGIAALERDLRIGSILSNIKETVAIKSTIEQKLDEIEIIEQDAIVNGELCVMFKVEGVDEGVFIKKSDIDSGALTLDDGYREIAGIVQEKNRKA